MKLSDTFDWTEGGSTVVDPAVAVDAAEIEDDDAAGAGGSPLSALGVKSDINVVDDDLIESSMDDADDETDLYMDSNVDDMLSLPVLHVRSFDRGFLDVDWFEFEDAIS
jgi:hypothetical protein